MTSKKRGVWIPKNFVKFIFWLYKIGIISHESGNKIVNKWAPILIDKFVKTDYEKNRRHSIE